MAENQNTQAAVVEKPGDAILSTAKSVKIEFTEASFGITKGEVKTVDAATAKRLIDAHVARAN